jgi:hypothetical protein
MGAIKPNYIMLAMLLLAAAAFGTGPVFFRDQVSNSVSKEALRRLRTGASLGYKIRPFVFQITNARITGPMPDAVEGTGIWRTLFGISVGEDQAVGSAPMTFNLDLQKWLNVWFAFLFVEAAMGTYCVWWIRKYWW